MALRGDSDARLRDANPIYDPSPFSWISNRIDRSPDPRHICRWWWPRRPRGCSKAELVQLGTKDPTRRRFIAARIRETTTKSIGYTASQESFYLCLGRLSWLSRSPFFRVQVRRVYTAMSWLLSFDESNNLIKNLNRKFILRWTLYHFIIQ